MAALGARPGVGSDAWAETGIDVGPARRAWAGRGDALAVAALLGLVGLLAGNRLVFDGWLPRFDLYTYFLPHYAHLGERLRDGDVPGWNPHLFGGTPFAGDPESGWMYVPAMVLFAALPTAAAFKAMVAVQLAIGGLSLYAFGRVLGLGPLAALAAAAAFVGGPFLQWTTYCCLIFGQWSTWVPLALLGVELAVRARSWRDRVACWFLVGFAVSQSLAGWVGEGWLYAGLLPAAYAGYRALFPPTGAGGDLRERLALGAATGLAGPALGLALGAAGVLPRLAFHGESYLAEGYGRLPNGGVLNPPWAPDYLLHQVLGGGHEQRRAALGGATVVLALLAPTLAGRRFATPFFAGLTAAAMLLTLDWTPLHPLFALMPRWQEFHEHDAWRALALGGIGPPLLVGAAVEGLAGWRGRWRALPVVVAPLALVATAAVVLWWVEGSIGRGPLLAAGGATLAVAVAVGAPRRGRRDAVGRWAPVALLALVVAQPAGMELTGSWLGWPRPASWVPHWEPDPWPERALADEVRAEDPGGAGEFLRARLAEAGPFRYLGYGGIGDPALPPQPSYMSRRFEPGIRAILTNGRPIYLGLYDVQGYNPLQLARAVEFMTALNGRHLDYHVAYLLATGVRSPLLDLLDVRYVLVDAALPPDRADVAALRAGGREVFRTPNVVVYERTPAPAHAWIVHDVRAVARGEALPLLTGGAVDPRRTALVEGTPPAVAAPPAGAAEGVRVTRYGADELTLEAEAAAPGLLVVSEVYEPGWRAYVDGEAVEILPTDHALRGVPLPAGRHTVELRYEPRPLRLGLLLTGVAGAGMLGAWGWAGTARLAGAGQGRRAGWAGAGPRAGADAGGRSRTPGWKPGANGTKSLRD